MMNADILINLTDRDGLFSGDPRRYPDAKLMPIISKITKDIETLAGEIPGVLGTGGMMSKIKAARKVMKAGIPMVIAKGDHPDILLELLSGMPLGTFFVPEKEKMTNRKCWIGITAKPKGAIIVDNGAAKAILRRGKSLLPSGITRVDGEFGFGQPVAIQTQNGHVIATGLVNYRAADIRCIMGLKTNHIEDILGHKPYDEIIHRNNLVITDQNPSR